MVAKMFSAIIAASVALPIFASQERGAIAFPEPTVETRPWGICHLLGNAVEKAEFEKEVRRWAEASIGGVRLVPLYGVKGNETNNIETMSPEFIELLKNANSIAAANGMKIDLSFGAGWCFGGKTIPQKLGCQSLKILKSGEKAPKDSKVLFERNGTRLVSYFTKQRLKRAQKMDSGLMMNPFSPSSMKAHLSLFSGLDGVVSAYPRAAFHDSFEYRCGWSDDFPSLFRKYRGYSIEDHYAELAGFGSRQTIARIKHDYRETLSDILVHETFPMWTEWCRKRGILTHNQAHGAPADLLSFYALADVPETEMFGCGKRDPMRSRFDGEFRSGSRKPLVSKFASSAAHLTGRRHVSAEAFTWMAEHFCESLEEMKAFGDLLFLSGITRLYYHAMPYSPDSVPWPGWCFYASSELTPRNPLWRDMKAVNAYFTRVQSILAEAKPDNDILLYWPVNDMWTNPSRFDSGLNVDGRWMDKTEFGRLAQRLRDAGYSFDYVSDPFLTEDVVSRYKAIVVPKTKYMKSVAFSKLKEFSKRMPVLFEAKLPDATPGFMSQSLDLSGAPTPVADAVASLRKTDAVRDAFVSSDTPFETLRTSWRGGKLYFTVNVSTSDAALSVPCGAVLLDAVSGKVSEVLRDDESYRTVVLAPAQSVFVYLKSGRIEVGRMPFVKNVKTVIPDDEWTLEFVRDVSGWEVPPKRVKGVLGDWTAFGEREEGFSGTALYRTTFKLSEEDYSSGVATLELGEVCNSAKVLINGIEIGTAFMHPYKLEIPSKVLKCGKNTLEIEVTNLGANRIRVLDQKRIKWKNFEDINVVNVRYRPLDASKWPVMQSGLIGPVRLQIMSAFNR